VTYHEGSCPFRAVGPFEGHFGPGSASRSSPAAEGARMARLSRAAAALMLLAVAAQARAVSLRERAPSAVAWAEPPVR
jgi:hypothetical protein